MKAGALHHVAIVVPSLEAALPFYTDTLGLRAGEPHDLPGQAVRAVFVEGGGTRLELIEPTEPSSGVGRFLAERGRSTLHHLCYEVSDLAAALRELEVSRVELVDRTPRPGLAGPVAFLHPRAADGVLIELIEVAGRESAYSTE